MSLLSICQWLQSTDFFTAIRGSWYVYPVIMSTHLAGIALFGGMILAVDLRLLGVAMRQRPVSDVIAQLRWLKRLGFILVATCGILMFGSKAEEYYYNAFFRAKMIILAMIFLHALAFRGSVYRQAAKFDKAGQIPGSAKLAATLSLVLWLGMIIAGRGIGYIEPPLDKIHAGLRSTGILSQVIDRNLIPGRPGGRAGSSVRQLLNAAARSPVTALLPFGRAGRVSARPSYRTGVAALPSRN